MQPNDTPRVQQQGREIKVESQDGGVKDKSDEGEKKAKRKKVKIKKGDVFGRLTAVRFLEKKGHNQRWEFQCDCGKVHASYRSHVLSGNTSSCGCLRAELQLIKSKEAWTKIETFKIWSGMNQRCYNPRHKFYHRYGGRGIEVCQEWKTDLLKFVSDMGPRPSKKHSIDRINNDGNYEPSNCRWATHLQQVNNTSSNRYIQFDGEIRTISQWSQFLGVERKALSARLANGWSIMKTLTFPIRKDKRRTNKHETKNN